MRHLTIAISIVVAAIAVALVLIAYLPVFQNLIKPSFPTTADVACYAPGEGGTTFNCSEIPTANDTILLTFPRFGVGGDRCSPGNPRTGYGTVSSVTVASYGSPPSGSATAHVTQISQECPNDPKPPFDSTFDWVVP